VSFRNKATWHFRKSGNKIPFPQNVLRLKFSAKESPLACMKIPSEGAATIRVNSPRQYTDKYSVFS